MSGESGPSRSNSSSSSRGAGIPTSTSSSGPFAADAARATPPAGQSSVARGKQPAQPASGPVQQPGGRVIQPGGGGGAAGGAATPAPGGAVSVGGPGGVVRRMTLNSILVNTRQKGNPVIDNIRTVPWEYGDIKCDYQVGATTGVLFLSIRYHLLHPEYIHQRIADLGQSYNLRIILVQCDSDNHTAAMKELTKVALVNGYTLMTCWTSQEAGRYLELYKQSERKPPDLIRERTDASYQAHMTAALTEVRGVNKTDVTTLMSNLGTFAKIVTAPASQLSTLPGIGDKKVRRLREAFTAPFVLQSGSAKRRKTTGEAEKRGESGERVLN
ncbi:restriction endonuclease type II-like protein [Rhodotorula diobovata]|uniref:Restriction endonuclease type II-like protein n=1 Tax=Rhodotorula diobovata TaxID=5288 RepID=A0A5C5FZF1_9BASI|nr:restriction endonuclease type II-like protein [Rhodotorula diobovata]